MEDESEYFEDDEQYLSFENIDFSLIASSIKHIPFFKDDLYLGMQAMNCGITDPIITEYEYALLREYHKIEKTPTELALTVSALSQMWIYALYEVLRMWRDRYFQFNKLLINGGIDTKIATMPGEDAFNLTTESIKRQLMRFKSDEKYRQSIEAVWQKLEPIYRLTELTRINLAKHCAPGKNNVISRAPGYGRINAWCGAMDFNLVESDNGYALLNRRDIADALRKCVLEIQDLI